MRRAHCCGGNELVVHAGAVDAHVTHRYIHSMSGQCCKYGVPTEYLRSIWYFVLWRTLPVQAGHVAAQPLGPATPEVGVRLQRFPGLLLGWKPCLFFCSHRQMAWRLCGRSESAYGQLSNTTSLAKQMVYSVSSQEVGQKMKRTQHNLHSRTLILVFGRDQPLLQNDMHDLWLWSPPQRALDWKANLVQGCARTPPLTRRQPHCFDQSSRATR
jgi:hypothetical protein